MHSFVPQKTVAVPNWGGWVAAGSWKGTPRWCTLCPRHAVRAPSMIDRHSGFRPRCCGRRRFAHHASHCRFWRDAAAATLSFVYGGTGRLGRRQSSNLHTGRKRMIRHKSHQKLVRQLWCGRPDVETVTWEDPVSHLVRRRKGGTIAISVRFSCNSCKGTYKTASTAILCVLTTTKHSCAAPDAHGT